MLYTRNKLIYDYTIYMEAKASRRSAGAIHSFDVKRDNVVVLQTNNRTLSIFQMA
jgi:hypothetical protein